MKQLSNSLRERPLALQTVFCAPSNRITLPHQASVHSLKHASTSQSQFGKNGPTHDVASVDQSTWHNHTSSLLLLIHCLKYLQDFIIYDSITTTEWIETRDSYKYDRLIFDLYNAMIRIDLKTITKYFKTIKMYSCKQWI